MKPFIKGTVLLAIVILLSKLFGFIYRMQFMRIAGPEVVGIYMTAYPAFIFFIALAQIGLPLAVTKLVSAYFTERKHELGQAVLKKALIISTFSFALLLPLLIFSAPHIAKTFLHNEAAVYTLYVSLFAIPFVLYASLIKAYLQGIEKIHMTAWSLFFEQVIRIGLITLLFPYLLSKDPALSAAYAMAITVITELAAALFIWPFYCLQQKRLHAKKSQNRKGQISTGQLLQIAIPTAGSKLFGTFTWFLEPIIFLRALATAGLSATAATTLYGILSGVHIPLLLFPAFIPAALSIVLVPAVSSALAKKDYRTIHKWIELAIRLSAIIGCYASVVFYLYGDVLAEKMFHIKTEAPYMKLLAPIFFFYYVQSPLMSILQAMNGVKTAMWNSIYGGLGKLIFMYVFASMPQIAIKGAILAIGFGVLLTTFLHLFSLKAIPKLHISIQSLFVPYICFICIILLPTPLLLNTLLLQITYSICLCTIALIVLKQIRLQDLRVIFTLFRKTTH